MTMSGVEPKVSKPKAKKRKNSKEDGHEETHAVSKPKKKITKPKIPSPPRHKDTDDDEN